MAIKQYFHGSVGPLLYDDSVELYAFRTNGLLQSGQHFVDFPPTNPNHVVTKDYLTSIGVGFFEAENKDAMTIKAGQVVASHPSGTGVILANASDSSRRGIGVAIADAMVGMTTEIILSGLVSLPDWIDGAGSPELSPAAVYYLDVVAGVISLTSPFSSGNISQVIGAAVAPSVLNVNISVPILL